MKYRSRKFIVTLVGMAMGTALAATGHMDGNAAIVLTAGIAAYNWANIKMRETE